MFITEPNLPRGTVKTAIISEREYEISNNLENLGINVVHIPENDYLEPGISSHPDMNFVHLGNGDYISYNKILNDSFNFIKETIPVKNDYKNCTKLNVVIIGNFCICNKLTCSDRVSQIGKEIIDVNQGYTKCSTLIVDNNSIITGDLGIHNKCKNFGINSLLVDNRDIHLNGYEYGFIGGIGGKISRDILAISGRLNTLRDYDVIKSYCRNVGVYIEELSSGNVKDIGGIIPIEEL